MIRSSADRPVLPSDVPTAVLRRAHLLAAGATGRQITDAVRDGRLLRLRRDHYLPRDTDPQVCAAVQWGGRLDCLPHAATGGVDGDRATLASHLQRRR